MKKVVASLAALLAAGVVALSVYLRDIPPSGVVEVPRSDLARDLGDASGWSRAVRISPRVEGERMAGFTLLEVTPGSVVHRLGLRAGDVVLAVGGVQLDAPEKPIAAQDSLQGRTEAEVKFLRDGRMRTFVVRATD